MSNKNQLNSVPYIHETETHRTKDAEIILPLLFQQFKPKSVLDVGCGLGTWLKVCMDHGIDDAVGVDGDYVERELMVIGDNNFITHDLKKPFNLNRKFDLAICLEVAEHLPESSADDFVESLVKHADTILFSAAIKGQDGYKHINCQWFPYWQEKFAKYGFKFYDALRGKIWWNDEVFTWYKQNIFIVSKNKFEVDNQNLICGFHPDSFFALQNQLNTINSGRGGVAYSFRLFLKSISQKLK